MLSSLWVLSANDSYPAVSLPTRWDGVFTEVEEKIPKKIEKNVHERIIAASLRVVEPDLSPPEVSFIVSTQSPYPSPQGWWEFCSCVHPYSE